MWWLSAVRYRSKEMHPKQRDEEVLIQLHFCGVWCHLTIFAQNMFLLVILTIVYLTGVEHCGELQKEKSNF